MRTLPPALKIILVICSLSALAFGQMTQSSAGPRLKGVPPGYELVWSDEFGGKALDLGKWDCRYLGKRGPCLVAKEAVRLDGKGHLVLTTSEDGDEIQVGMVGTQGKFECKYGFFESRIKFQKLQGHHGAFWLQSPTYGKVPDDPGQSGAEIDIVEFYGTGRPDGGVQTSVHWNPYPKTSKSTTAVDLAPILGVKRTGKTAKAKEISDDFHVFALEWTEKEYRFFIDGLEVFRTSEGLSHRSEYIVLSLISSDWEVARLDRKKLPDSMMVDYVHVYAKK